jgi:hypothetical protein
MPSVLQDWVCELPYMQQSVLIAAVRGPDTIKKEHIAKRLLRWFRRCTLLSAFDGEALNDPFKAGGGSFTGPLKKDGRDGNDVLTELTKDYLRTIDELPHHFQLHFMHAAEILGYKHPIYWIRRFWNFFYLAIVKDAHLNPEPLEDMDRRLGDRESTWREAEVVTAH